MNEGVNIPFSFPVDPNAEELLGLIDQLITETNTLRKSMMDLPIDQLNEKKRQYIKVLADASIETMKLNQNQKEEQAILADISKTVETYIDKIDNCVKLQKLFTAEGDKAQKMLDSYSKEMIKASNGINDLKDKISSLNKIQEEGGRLTKAQENQLVGYADKIKLLGKSIEDNNLILDIYYSKVKENSSQMQAETGVIEALETQLKELRLERKQLTEEEIAASDIYSTLTKQIADITNILAVYNKEASGQLELEAALNKVKESNIILENKTIALAEVDIEIKAKQVVANNELSAAISKRVAQITGADMKEADMAYELYVKEQELNQKKILSEEERLAKQLRAREISYEKMWLQAEKLKLKEDAAAASGNSAIEKSTSLFGNFGSIFEKMGLRMVASLIWWTAIIGAVTVLYEWWSKVDETTQLALDKLKDYFEDFKSLQKSILDSKNIVLSNIFFDKAEAETYKSILLDKVNYSLDQRYQAYQKLNQIAPKVLDDLNLENFARAENTKRMQDQLSSLDKFIVANDKLSDIKNKQKENQKLLLENEDEETKTYAKIKKQYGSEVGRKFSDSEIDRIIKAQAQTQHYPGEGVLQGSITDLTNIRDQRAKLQSDLDFSNSKRDELEREIASLEGNVKHPKGRRGPKDHQMQDALYEAKEMHGDFVQDIRENYDATKKSFNDRKDMYESDMSETQRYYEKQIEIIDKFGKLSGESETKLQGRRLQALREKKLSQNQITELGQKELLEMKKYNDEKLKIIDDTNHEIELRVEQHRRNVEDADKSSKKGASGKRKASRINLLSAFFGGDGNTSTQDFKDSLRDRDDQIKEDSSNVNSSAGLLNQKDWDIMLKKQEISKDNETSDKNKSPEQILDSKRHLEELKKFEAEKKELSNKSDKDQEKLQQDKDAKDISIKQRKKDNEILVAQKTLEATEKIANSGFELQKKRIQNQMNNVQGLADFEMTLAGNNSSAKLKIAQREHSEMLALKRKEAEVEKNQAIFQATLEMGKGIASALAVDPPYGFILAGLVAASELKAISDISNAPLPSYEKGRKGGKSERARINEKGLELVESTGGKFKIFGGGSETIADLQSGDTVHTHNESIKILEANSFLNSLVRGTGIINKRDDIQKHERASNIQNALTKDDIQSAMENAVKKIPVSTMQLPARDVEDRHQRQQIRNGL